MGAREHVNQFTISYNYSYTYWYIILLRPLKWAKTYPQPATPDKPTSAFKAFIIATIHHCHLSITISSSSTTTTTTTTLLHPKFHIGISWAATISPVINIFFLDYLTTVLHPNLLHPIPPIFPTSLNTCPSISLTRFWPQPTRPAKLRQTSCRPQRRSRAASALWTL